MKLNPYPVFLVTGALMCATVLLAQLGSGVALLKAGAASVNQDVSSFAVKTISSLGGGPRTLVARDDAVTNAAVAEPRGANTGGASAVVANTVVANTRLAALDHTH